MNKGTKKDMNSYRPGRLFSILLGLILAVESVPFGALNARPAFAANSPRTIVSDARGGASDELTLKETEAEASLTDEEVTQWMAETGLGSGQIITGGETEEENTGDGEAIKDEALNIEEHIYYRADISVDDDKGSQMTLKEAFSAAQNKNSGKVPIIKLKYNMFIDEPITIQKGKTVHLFLNGMTLYRSPSGSGKENVYYLMDRAESSGNLFSLQEDAKLIITGGVRSQYPIREERYTQQGVTYRESEKYYTCKTGRLVGGYTSGGGGAIYAAAKSTVDLRDLTIANCAAKNGGAIYAESQANIQLNNTKITCNFAKSDGGAVYLNGARGVLNMDNESELTANRATDNGGAVCLDSEKIIVSGGGKTVIDGNLAEKDGGAIYLPDSGNNSVKGISFKDNAAQRYGGAIYANGKDTTIGDSAFENNYAKQGGGIYINAKHCGVSSVTMTKNRTGSQGGAIWVDSQDDLGISGTVSIKDNYAGNNGTLDNIALQNGYASTAYLDLGGSLGAGSEVWVHDSDNKSRRLTVQPGNYNARYFRVDGGSKHVEFRGDRHLYISDGAPDTSQAEVNEVTYTEWKTKDITRASSEAEGKTEYKYTAADGAEYPVYYGYASSPSYTTGGTDIVRKYYYSDGFFFSDPRKYDDHLATFGLNFAMAGFESNIKTQTDYRYKFTNIKGLMQQIGIAEDDIYINDWYTRKPTDDSIGVAIGKKTINNTKGEEYTLVPIAIRGGGYEKEWAGNVTINGENTDDMKDEHSGFKSARTHVMEEIRYYLRNYGLESELKKGRIKFFIAGYSRGSAATNLTGKILVDTYGENSGYQNKNQVFAYCYEVPAGGTDYRDNSKVTGKNNECYYCIHNIINKVDLVPMVAPYEMGFKRYGVDHYVPGDPSLKAAPVQTDKPAEVKDKVDNVTLYYDNDPWYVGDDKYKAQREKMVKQLTAVNDEIDFVDYFDEYYITMGKMNFVKNWEAYTFHKAGTGKKMENWLPEFFGKLQKWNLLSADTKLTRENYSRYVMKEGQSGKGWYESGVTAQDTFRGLVQMMFAKTPEDQSKLTGALSGVLNKFNDPVTGSGNTLLTLYNDLIGDDKGWDRSRDIQQKWLDELWSKLTDNRHGQKGIQDAMTPSELKDFKSYFPTLMGIVFRLLKYDYDNAGTVDKSTSEQMWLAGTFAKNSDTILLGHVPEVILAWLRSYDNWYDADLKKTAYTGTGSGDTAVPRVMKKTPEGQLVELTDKEVLSGENRTVYLQGGSGDAIFYTLEKDGSASAAKLYNGSGIRIDDEGSYKLTAYAMSDYAEQAAKANGDRYWTKNWKDSAKTSISFSAEAVAARDIYYKEKANADFAKSSLKQGSALSYSARSIYEDRPFVRWEVSEDKDGRTPYRNAEYGITDAALNNIKLDIRVPDRTVYIFPVYASKTVSIETIVLEKAEIGKPLPERISSLTYKNEGIDAAITYPRTEDLKVYWSQAVTTDSGTRNLYPIARGTIVKKDLEYVAEIRIPPYVNGVQSFTVQDAFEKKAVIPGYEFDSQKETSKLGVSTLLYRVTEKKEGVDPPAPLPAGRVQLKRMLLGGSESDRSAFEKVLTDRYGSEGLYIRGEKDQIVTADTWDVLLDDEIGDYIPVGFKVTPEDIRLYDEDGDEIEIKTWEDDGSALAGARVIEGDDVTFKLPEGGLTLEAVFVHAGLVKAVDLVLEAPETGLPLREEPEEAKIKVSVNNEEKVYELDPGSGIDIQYSPEGDEEAADGLTYYTADVSMTFDSLKEKGSGKTLKELMGYAYDGILTQPDDIVLTVRDDDGEEVETDMAGLLYSGDEETGIEEWYATGYSLEAYFDLTMPACILAVYDEEKWLDVKKDETTGEILYEEKFDDGINGKRTSAASWEGLKSLLPKEVSIVTDVSSTETLPVTWNKPGDEEFKENTVHTQMFTLVGEVPVPEDLFVWDEEKEIAEDQKSLMVLCDVTIEASEAAAKPVAMPEGRDYYNNVSVTLSSETEGAKIWYTLDGSEPVDEQGNLRSAARSYDDTKIKSDEGYEAEPGIYIDTPGETVIKAVSVKEGMACSETMTERYTIVDKPEAGIPEEDLEILGSLYLEEGMCLDDLTAELPEGWSWHELQDIDTEYRISDLIGYEDDEGNIFYDVSALLKYNPDPEKYTDAYMEIDIPLYGEQYSVDIIDGEAFTYDGDELYEAEKGETVYIVADYPMEMLESYEFERWVAVDSAGNTIDVEMASEEKADEYPDALKDEEDGEFYDGAASFEMPGNDVVVIGVFKRYDESKEIPEEIEEKTVASLTLDKQELKLKAGDKDRGSGTLEASVSFTGDGIEPSLSFRCSDTNVARIQQSGNKVTVTAVRAGDAVIWAVCGDKVAKCLVSAEPGPLDAVSITVKNGRALDKTGSPVTTALKGEELTLKADKAPDGYKFMKWTVRGASSISGDTMDPEAEVRITVGARDITAEALYETDKEAEGFVISDDGTLDSLIDLKAGEQHAVSAVLMPLSSLKQVASIKYQILSKYDAAKLNAPLKYELDSYPELKALAGQKLPKIAGVSGGLIKAKWDKKLTKAGKTSGMTVLRVTMKLVKEKGEKKAVQYVCDYPIRVTATDYETKGLKNLKGDRSYSLSAKSSLTTLDTGVAGKDTAALTATISKAEKKDSVRLQFTSTNEKIISVEGASETAAELPGGKKAAASCTLRAKGIGTAYVTVKSIDKENGAIFNQRIVKITVKSSNPEIVLTGDSGSLLPVDGGGKIKPGPDGSVTINMKQGSYDRFYLELDPAQSTDASKLKWSASGGVTVKNGVIFAKKATKEGKPAKVTIRCAKSKPVTIFVNVVN